MDEETGSVLPFFTAGTSNLGKWFRCDTPVVRKTSLDDYAVDDMNW
jgi:hypothetical protein